MYYTYLLRCRDGSIYVGITTDLFRRFRQHAGELKGGARYTALRPPLGYAAAFESEDRARATGLEQRLKRLDHRGKEAAAAGKEPVPEWLAPYRRLDREELDAASATDVKPD